MDEPEGLEQIMAAYGLPLPQALRRATGGVQNDVWILDVGTERLVLKRFRRGDVPDLRRVIAVMDRVRDHIPIPRLKTHDGDQALLDTGLSRYALSEHARGVQRNRGALTVLDAAAMGRTLGTLHVQPDVTDLNLPTEVRTASTSEVQSRLEVVLRAISGGAPEDGAAVAHLTSRAQWLETGIGDPAPLDRDVRLVHSDFTDANLFFADEHVSGVIDWDQAHQGSLDHELMRAADYSFADGEALWAAFLAAYREHRPLDLADLDAAAEAYAFRRDRGLWAYEEVYLRRNDAARMLIRSPDFVPWINRWHRIRTHL